MRTFYNTSRTGATRVWSISVDGHAVHTEFGQLNGKMQSVTDYGTAKNVGRSNEISAEEDARNLAERMILEKTRKGYTTDSRGQTESWLNPFDGDLPERLSFYKPKNSMSVKMTKMVENGEAWAIRKYDGEMMVIVKDLEGFVSIYSRRMLPSHHLEQTPWTVRFDHICEEITDNEKIPPGTILLGEMVADFDKDDRWHVAQVLKSKSIKALQIQREHPLCYVVWDVAWWGGEQLLSEVPLRERLDYAVAFTMGRYVGPPMVFTGLDYIQIDPYTDEQLSSGIDCLMNRAASEGWEGFVVVDPDATYGDKAFNLRGKPDRPAGCCKLKPIFEDDFIAFFDPDEGVGSYGRGRNTGKLGSVELYQYNEDGDLVYICDMGNGWTKEFISQNSTAESWPKVVQVKYESRTYVAKGDKTNALQFPRFVLERTDKSAEECINPEL